MEWDWTAGIVSALVMAVTVTAGYVHGRRRAPRRSTPPTRPVKGELLDSSVTRRWMRFSQKED